MASEDADGEDGDQWRFSLEDLEGEGEGESESGDEEARGGNVAGSLRSRGEIEPGDIDLENAFFVLLGALVTGLLIFSAVRYAAGF